MNELIIACLAGLAIWCSGLSLYIFKMATQQTKIQFALLMISKRAADFLHHPDDRYKLDYLVEKYIQKGHDLTNEEWEELLKKVSAIAEDKNIAKNERLAAGLLHDLSSLVKELSIHKLTRWYTI